MEIASPFQRSRYDSFQFTGTKRSSKGLTVLGTYVYSVNKDNSSSTVEGSGTYPRSSANPEIDYNYSDFDVRHRMNMSVVYDLPWKLNGAAGAVLNDWQANMIMVARSGLPYSVLSGTDRSLTGIGRDNADQVGDITPAAGSDVLVWFNAAAFAPAALGTYGNTARNGFRGPGAFTVDMALARNFPIGPKAKLQFRIESFNPFNTTNFNNPNATYTAGSNFGKITGAGDPRVFQLGVKFTF